MNTAINLSVNNLPLARGIVVSQSAEDAQAGDHVIFRDDIILKVNSVEDGIAYCESTTFYPKKNFDVPVKELRRLLIELIDMAGAKISFKFSQWKRAIELNQVDNVRAVMNFEVRTKIFDKHGNKRETNKKILKSDIEVRYGKIVNAPMMVASRQKVGFNKAEITQSIPLTEAKIFSLSEMQELLESAYTAGMLNAMTTPGNTKADFKAREVERAKYFNKLKAKCG